MAFKLTAAHKKKRDTLIEELRTLATGIEDAIRSYNAKLEDAREFVNLEIVGHFQDEFDEKSENWQEGDRGSATQEWLDTLDNIGNTLEDIDSPFDDDGIEEIVSILEEMPEEPEY